MEQLVAIFENANNIFLKKEAGLILSGVSERTLCGALMKYLHGEIKNSVYNRYYVDVEYNRNNGKVKTIMDNEMKIITINCDVIVHSRGEIIEQDNLIAIEMKKSTAGKNEKTNDKNRLIALSKDNFDETWSYDGKSFPQHVCRYRLGIYYEINVQRKLIHLEYYSQGKFRCEKKLRFQLI